MMVLGKDFVVLRSTLVCERREKAHHWNGVWIRGAMEGPREGTARYSVSDSRVAGGLFEGEVRAESHVGTTNEDYQ